MLLDLKKVFSNDSESCPFDYSMDLSSTDINGYYPFVSPVSVKGAVKSHDGFAKLDADVAFNFSIPCDRCTKQINKQYHYTFAHTLVLSLENEDDDSYIQVQDYKLDLDELMRADILLELPTKFLCSGDCKGLCPVCGKNLNDGACNCDLHQVDPRLEVLKKLIE
jgi:Predicted metal-binding, possibly nucleic acid-binding protein